MWYYVWYYELLNKPRTCGNGENVQVHALFNEITDSRAWIDVVTELAVTEPTVFIQTTGVVTYFCQPAILEALLGFWVIVLQVACHAEHGVCAIPRKLEYGQVHWH